MQKRRKVDGGGGAAGGGQDKAVMTKMYTEINAMKSEVGELLNTYFVDPVSKAVSAALEYAATKYKH